MGEIHLDHVGVTYQKNDFERDTREWLDAVRFIRGEGPMQPRKARDLQYDENQSTLARMFSRFRCNDAGVKCLIPGDGDKALHEKARQWGQAFHNGQPEYQMDVIWFNGAIEHDRIKSGQPAPDDQEADDLRDRLGLDGEGNGGGDGDRNGGQGEPGARPETESERFDRYRTRARALPGIDGHVSLGRYARKSVQGYVTEIDLANADGERVPSIAHALRGGDIEVFVDATHPVFTEYGRDLRDFAWVEIAESLRTMSSGDMSVTSATAEVISQFPDQRFTDAAIRERADSLVNGACVTLQGLHTAMSSQLWSALSALRKEATEVRAAAANADLDWGAATRDGTFIEFLDAYGLAELVRQLPAHLLDGQVFRTKYATWTSTETRDRAAERVARLLDTVAEYLSDGSSRPSGELRLIQVVLDNLAADLAIRL